MIFFFTFSQKDKSWSILKSILQELDKLVVIGKDGEERGEEEEREEDQGGKGGKGGEMADHRNFLGSIFGQNILARANHPSSCHFFACPPWSSTFSLFNFPLLRNRKLNPLWHYATSQAMRCMIAWLHNWIFPPLIQALLQCGFAISASKLRFNLFRNRLFLTAAPSPPVQKERVRRCSSVHWITKDLFSRLERNTPWDNLRSKSKEGWFLSLKS